MKRKLFLSILIVFFTTSFMSLVGCENVDQKKKVKEEYDLQEKCKISSEDYFHKNIDFRYSDKEKHLYWYENHYNKKMNKCFISVKDVIQEKGGEEMVFKKLINIQENKEYGQCFINEIQGEVYFCNVLDKNCKSIEEWDKLVKPYMED